MKIKVFDENISRTLYELTDGKFEKAVDASSDGYKNLSYKEYLELLDKLDMVVLKNILDVLHGLECPMDSDDEYNFADFMDPGKMKYNYLSQGARDEMLPFFRMWKDIGHSVSSLSKHSESIKNDFSNCPWDAIEVVGHILNKLIINKDYKKFLQYKEILLAESEMLQNMVQEIIDIVEITKPHTTVQSNIVNANSIYRSMMHKEKFSSSYSDLVNIKKIANPTLDANAKNKIIKLLSYVPECDASVTEGRAALLAITWMVGEETKSLSDQTKALNSNINFKALKEFRDTVHYIIDEQPGGEKLLQFLSNNSSKEPLSQVQEYLYTLLNDIESLQIKTYSDDEFHEVNRTRTINNIDSAQHIKTITDIISKIISTQSTNSLKDQEDRMNVFKSVCDHKLPIPMKFDVYKFICKFFFPNNTMNKKISDYEKHFETIFDNANKTYIDSEGKEQQKPKRTKIEYEKVKKDIEDCAEAFSRLKLISTSAHDASTNPKSSIRCLDSLEEAIKSHNISSQTTDKIQYFLNLFLHSLEEVVGHTNTIIKNANGDISIARNMHNNHQTHYCHLFHLIVIGQSIQNLFSDKSFIPTAPSEFLIELDFLKWVRNGLMHSQDISELGSTFSYFCNDAFRHSIDEDPIRVYDSAQYLSSIKAMLNNVLTMRNQNQKIQKNKDDTHYSALIIKQLAYAYKDCNTQAEKLIVDALEVDERLRIKENGIFDKDDTVSIATDNNGKTYYNITTTIHNSMCETQKTKKVYDLSECYKGDFALVANNALTPPSEFKIVYLTDSEHDITGHILQQSKNFYIDTLYTNTLFDKKEQIYALCKDFGITLHYFHITMNHQQKLEFFIQDTISETDLARFKQELHSIVQHRFMVLNQAHLMEYNRKSSNAKQIVVDNQNTFKALMHSIELPRALQNMESPEVIRDILKENFDLNLTFEGYTSLQRAYFRYHSYNYARKKQGIEIIKMLLYKGADVNVQDKHGNTLAHYLAQDGEVKLLQLLDKYHADFNIKNHAALTPLEVGAMYNKSQQLYGYLSERTNLPPIEKLIQAIRVNDICAVKKCLEEGNISPDLLNAKIEPNGSEHREFVFHFACKNCNIKMLKLLIEHGCDPLVKDSDGRTGLYEPFSSEHSAEDIIATAEYLQLLGLTLNDAHEDDDNSLLFEAIFSKQMKVVKYLLQHGVNPDCGHSGSFSPLLSILNLDQLNNYYIKVIKMLLQYGADVLSVDGYVGNALHLAAERGHAEVIDIIVDHARNKNKLDKLLILSPESCYVWSGKSSFAIAMLCGNAQAAYSLAEYFDIDPEYIRKSIEDSVARKAIKTNYIVDSESLMYEEDLFAMLAGDDNNCNEMCT